MSEAYRGDDDDPGDYVSWLGRLQSGIEPGASVLDLGCGCGVPVARRLATRHRVIGIDISPRQIERARRLVPGATFMCADMTEVAFPAATFGAVVCLYAIIHVSLADQPGLIGRMASWVRDDGIVLATVGAEAWTGYDDDWLGVPGARMWWSHADAPTYRRWFEEAGLVVEQEAFVAEGTGGHTLLVARRSRATSGAVP